MSQLEETQHLKISFKVIKKATNSFKTCIGRGGYGRVYKGELVISGQLTTVAVKRLDKQFGQGSKEFLTEIDLLKGQKHRNLICLVGYCDERDEKIIVYEYAERGSLDQYIRPNTKTCKFSWLERLTICVDIARGLDMLHNHVRGHQAIIHRDMKSSNILLDGNWVAKISDLGLSKLCLDNNGAISIACGTPGYVDPEYMKTGIVTKESDVYSFGMVLIEILCGRLCLVKDDDGLMLTDYHKKKKLHSVIDPNLRAQMSSDSLSRFLSIAYGCLHQLRAKRYRINHVLKKLEEALTIEFKEDEDERCEGGKKPQALSSDSQGWFSEFPFHTYVTRRNKVAKIFDIFDLNKDGGLSRKEVAAFLFVTKHCEEQLSTCTDEVFSMYHKYIDGKKGFTYHGLLQYYDDERSDLDSDVVQLLSDSDDSNKRKKLKWLFEKVTSIKDGGLNGQELAASRKSLLQKIGGLAVEVFNWYRKRGLTSGSLLTLDDDGVIRDQSDLESELLELLLKPDDEAAALWIPPPERDDRYELLTTELLTLLITLLIWLTTMILVKLKYVLVLFLIVFNSINVFLDERMKMP
ncbi:putative protein kinase RLK-Pelle-LRR-I-1 family [Helianthus anomalus]